MSTSQQHSLGPTRARILGELQATAQPRSVGDIAEAVGIHKNSARFHLDALVAEGYAQRVPAHNGTQGRPPLIYSATNSAPTLSNRHLLDLTDVLLVEFVATAVDGLARAESAGHRWGTEVAGQNQADEPILDALADNLAERGFGTRVSDQTLCFTRCPYREAMSEDRLPMVCAVHQGFLNGYLAASPGDLRPGQLKIGATECSAEIYSATDPDVEASSGQ